jgi:hypothetical protein
MNKSLKIQKLIHLNLDVKMILNKNMINIHFLDGINGIEILINLQIVI